MNKGLLPTILVGVLLLAFPVQNEVAKTGTKKVQHVCPLKHCPFQNEITFVQGCGNCSRGTDCWKLDSIHFVNPGLDYDGCETIFNTLTH